MTLTLTLEPVLVYPWTKSALNWSILYSVEDPIEVGLIWYTVYPHRWAASLTMIVALPGHPSATSTEWEVSWGEAMVRARRHTCSITVWKKTSQCHSFILTHLHFISHLFSTNKNIAIYPDVLSNKEAYILDKYHIKLHIFLTRSSQKSLCLFFKYTVCNLYIYIKIHHI